MLYFEIIIKARTNAVYSRTNNLLNEIINENKIEIENNRENVQLHGFFMESCMLLIILYDLSRDKMHK